MFYFITLLIILGLIIAARTAYARFEANKAKEEYEAWKASQQYTMLQIWVPKDNDKTPLAAEQFFSSLHGIFTESAKFQPQVSFEIVGMSKFIHFYVYVPTYLKEFVEGQLYAQYPEAEIKEAEDYIGFADSKSIALAELSLTKEGVYPIKTFNNFTVDPLAGITGVLGNIKDDENLWLQCIVKPVADDWQDFGVKLVKAKREGKSLEEPSKFFKFLQSIANFILFVIRSGSNISSGSEEKSSASAPSGGEETSKLPTPQEAALKGVEEKITKLGFEVKLRVLATSIDEPSARGKVESMVGAFKQFNTTNMNGFKIGEVSNGAEALSVYQAREFDDKGYTLNTEELASIFHLPSASVATPSIVWAGSKKGEPPADLPIEGRGDENDITFFGVTNFRNYRYKFGIRQKDRRLHMYTIGKTGTGKSTLLENMIIDDINKGKGVAIVDPHGQTVDHILGQIPEHRIKDVIYFNPADREMPLGFNLLEAVNPDLRSVAASGVLGIFKKLWADSWGPRLEYILRNAILALIEAPDANLLGINRLLVDRPYRQFVISHLTDPVVKQYFETEYENYSPQFRTEAIAPIQNKVGQFLSAKTIRNIIGQAKSSFDVRRVMDEQKILLIDLSTGKIGEDTAALLGSMLITKIQLAAMSRADVHESQRPDFYLYVDEFQNFATESFATILSEARKYHLNLVLTNQFMAQIPEVVKSAIFGNVGTIVSYRVGATDAGSLVKEFEPVFNANDLVNLDNFHIYTKLSVNGVTRPAFSAATLPPFPETDGFKNKVIEFSRQTYGRPEAQVEAEIKDFTQAGRPEHLRARDEKLKRIQEDEMESIDEVNEARRQQMPENQEKSKIQSPPQRNSYPQQEKFSPRDDKQGKPVGSNDGNQKSKRKRSKNLNSSGGAQGYKQFEGKNNAWYIGENSKPQNGGEGNQNKQIKPENSHNIEPKNLDAKKGESGAEKSDTKKPKRTFTGPLLVMKDDKSNKKDDQKIDFDELDRLFGKDEGF